MHNAEHISVEYLNSIPLNTTIVRSSEGPARLVARAARQAEAAARQAQKANLRECGAGA